jgi:hypothetical protein
LAGLVAAIHRLATGRAITIAEAREYFNHPESLANVVRQSGLVNDPQRRFRLQQLIAAQEKEESTHGV